MLRGTVEGHTVATHYTLPLQYSMAPTNTNLLSGKKGVTFGGTHLQSKHLECGRQEDETLFKKETVVSN